MVIILISIIIVKGNLSEIKITKAEHLDKNKNFINDIYEKVNQTDNITYTIPENHYARAYFEEELTNENIIDIFVDNNKPAKIEVYEKDSNIIVGEIHNVSKGYYYIKLNHTSKQSIFDLKSVGGEVVYDYIHDAIQVEDYAFDPNSTSIYQGDEISVLIGYSNPGNANSIDLKTRINSSNGTDSHLLNNSCGDEVSFKIISGTCTPGGGSTCDFEITQGITNFTNLAKNNKTIESTVILEACTVVTGDWNLTSAYLSGADPYTFDLWSGGITISFLDNILPDILITFPPNNTNYSYSGLEIDYSVSDETSLDSCWWTNDTGSTNQSISCGTNITGKTWDEGINVVTVWTNDTRNNQNYSSVTFGVDTTPPYFTTIPANASLNLGQSLGVDFDAIDDGDGFDSFAINWTSTFQINQSGWIENTSELLEGIYLINVTINDTNNFMNSTIYKVTVVADTCTAPGVGNWEITCSDNCIWNTDFTVPQNITMTGSGILTWNANMTMTAAKWEIYKEDGCEMAINPGGSIR